MTSTDKLFSLLLSAKRPWTPTETSDHEVTPGAAKTIQRCLALRHLELPVGEWITSASSLEQEKIGDLGMKLLQSNIADEIRHDLQLNNAFDSLSLAGTDFRDQIEGEAKGILSRWLDMANVYHPATVAFTAEAGVFIPALTMLRRIGSVALGNIANDISADESLHLRTHREVGVVIGGEPVNDTLHNLRKETLEWLTADLREVEKPGKYSQKRTYFRSSEKLIKDGKADEIKDTGKATMISFFEVSNNHIPVYG